MKYTKKSGIFASEQLSVSETITELDDVISIAKDIIENLAVQEKIKDLGSVLANLNGAKTYLPLLKHETDIALKFVPESVQTKRLLVE